MKAVYSIYEAKARLSEVIRTVKRNRQVTITERGAPVARVVPWQPRHGTEGRIAELEAAGRIVPAQARWPETVRPGAPRRGALRRFLRDRNRA